MYKLLSNWKCIECLTLIAKDWEFKSKLQVSS